MQEERTGFPPPLYPSFSHSPSKTVRTLQASSWNFPPQVKDVWVAYAGLSLSRHNAQAHCPVAPVLPPTSVRPPWVFFFHRHPFSFFNQFCPKVAPKNSCFMILVNWNLICMILQWKFVTSPEVSQWTLVTGNEQCKNMWNFEASEGLVLICWPPDGEFQRGLCQIIVHTLHEVSCVVC